jgi:hypothetical protein
MAISFRLFDLLHSAGDLFALKGEVNLEEMDNEKKRTARGVSTSDLVMSAYVSDNADVFPKILSLYVPEGSVIADVTYGKGVFWRNVDESKYHLIKSDAQMGVDARNLPYEDGSLDALVLDPPYMEGFYRRRADHQGGQGSHSAFSDYYNHLAAMGDIEGRPKYHDAVLDVYYRSGEEAGRVLKDGGIFIVKCQDEVSANQQRLTHVEIINYYSSIGFIPEDIFVVVRTNKPSVSRLLKQAHARKNHSYFVIMRKDAQKASKQFENLRRVWRLQG